LRKSSNIKERLLKKKLKTNKNKFYNKNFFKKITKISPSCIDNYYYHATDKDRYKEYSEEIEMVSNFLIGILNSHAIPFDVVKNHFILYLLRPDAQMCKKLLYKTAQVLFPFVF